MREATVAESAYTRNWWRRVRTLIPTNKDSGQRRQLQTDRDLQLGHPPQRIIRIFEDRVGSTAGPDHVSTFPEIATSIYIPHQPISRQQTTVSMAPKTIANDAYVPAIYVGNPQG